MNRLKQNWQKWSERIDAMALRERAIVFFAIALALLFLFIKLASEPLNARQRETGRNLAQKQVDTRMLQEQSQKLLAESRHDPDAERKARVEALRKRAAELDTRLAEKQRELVPPERVTGMLEEMLRRDRKLELVDLHSLPPTPLFGEDTAAPSEKKTELAMLVYRHGVELTVRGSYFDLLNYLSALEKLPLRLFWGEVEIVGDEYPVISMKLSVYTLSLERSWVVV